MKKLTFIFYGLFFACGAPDLEINGTQLSIEEPVIRPRALNEKKKNPHPFEIPYWESNSENDFSWMEPGLTKLRFSNFTFKIAGEMWRMEEDSRDTLTISEDVGYYLEGRKMWIESQDSSDRFELYMSVHQRINEQYDYRMHDAPDFDWENWEKEKVKFEIRSDYYRVRDSSGFYRLPWVQNDGGFFSKRFKSQHNYIDTLRHIDGEMGGSQATLFIQNKFCIYWNDFAMFKIVKTSKDGTITNHFFKMWYSYGC